MPEGTIVHFCSSKLHGNLIILSSIRSIKRYFQISTTYLQTIIHIIFINKFKGVL